jgi:hypothetical protein
LPRPPGAAVAVLFALITAAGLAGLGHAWVAGACLGLTASVLGLLTYADCAIAMSYWRDAVDRYLHRNNNLRLIGLTNSAVLPDDSCNGTLPHEPEEDDLFPFHDFFRSSLDSARLYQAAGHVMGFFAGRRRSLPHRSKQDKQSPKPP